MWYENSSILIEYAMFNVSQSQSSSSSSVGSSSRLTFWELITAKIMIIATDAKIAIAAIIIFIVGTLIYLIIGYGVIFELT